MVCLILEILRYQWYFRNELTMNKKKYAVMSMGIKMQLQSLNLDQFSIKLESSKIELVNKAKYLGLLVKGHLSWDDHILQLCIRKNMNCYLHVPRRLNKILPKQLLLKVCKSYIFSPNYITKSPSGDVLLRVTSLTLSQWSSSGNPVAIQCAWNLDPSVHSNATGEMPVCFQWSSSGLPVAFQWSSSVFQ